MENLKLPVGIENFEEIRTKGFYYVDKTELIRDLLNSWGKVNLFTRPRRFGKTLNMSMLKYFFEIGTDSALFDALAISREEAAMSKKDFKAARAAMPYPSISYRLADELQKITSQEIRVTIPGHFQRGGAPCAADRLLCTRLGVAAAELIREGKFGNMVAVQNDRIVPVPLKEVAGRLKTVPVDGELVRAARELGLCMGD